MVASEFGLDAWLYYQPYRVEVLRRCSPFIFYDRVAGESAPGKAIRSVQPWFS